MRHIQQRDLFCVDLCIKSSVPNEIHDPSLRLILAQVQLSGKHA